MNKGGMKFDDGKVLAGVLFEFRMALFAVAEIGTFGAKKYKRGSWVDVPNARVRYYDALWRHLLEEGNDLESGLLHKAHLAWNALADLELTLRERVDKIGDDLFDQH